MREPAGIRAGLSHRERRKIVRKRQAVMKEAETRKGATI